MVSFPEIYPSDDIEPFPFEGVGKYDPLDVPPEKKDPLKKGKTSGCGVGQLLRFWIVVTDTLDIEDEGDEVVADDWVDLEVGDEGLIVKVCNISDIDDHKCGRITDDIV